ncbi:alpha/beta hydrolase [Microbacterium protaetiae]|uniref:Alpha/beta hydrolase n=1 Tax=Microbacterium protaetiae TaxID=2509458 RepID=A0A4P6ECI8_9MICO|nr:alpha/beta hydrolase [Microbacterium protaetiae]QAY59346.1 alpha/beta hydrolase [Microbacterium protaetiae]
MTDGPRVLRDLVFAENVGFRPLSLDLHLPAVPGAALVVFLHGGGWRAGSRRVLCPAIEAGQAFPRIVAAGLAVASLDYRLSGEARFPAQIDDVAAALAWLRAHADGYGVDASRMVLWGESAGATLAALAGLEDPGVRGVVDWYGPADLPAMAEALGQADDPTTREAGWLGHPLSADPARARAASPVSHVRAGAPPFLICHGLADEAVPPAQSQALAAALRAVGAPVELTLVPGAGHMWHGADVDRLSLVDAAAAFCTRVCR